MTEDADLGMRLYRLGYRAETLTRYTVEDAPVEPSIDAPLILRTRWMAGRYRKISSFRSLPPSRIRYDAPSRSRGSKPSTHFSHTCILRPIQSKRMD